MVIQRTRGVLLHQIPYSETSKILKVYTPDSGLTGLIARGAHRPKSTFRGILNSFSLLELEFHHRNQDNLGVLRNASVIHTWNGIIANLEKQALGNVYLEIFLRHLFHAESSLPLFNLLTGYLETLDKQSLAAPENLCDFIIQFCGLMGFQPQFRHCASCGKPTHSTSMYFDLAMGTPACRNCYPSSVHRCTAPGDMLRWLDQLSQSGGYAASVEPSSVEKAEDLLLQFLYHHSSRSGALKSYAFYRRLTGSPFPGQSSQGPAHRKTGPMTSSPC